MDSVPAFNSSFSAGFCSKICDKVRLQSLSWRMPGIPYYQVIRCQIHPVG